LPLVHKLALQGIALTKTDSPPFQHAFGAEVDFYFIHLGEEWDYALNEKSLTFYHSPQFQDLTFYLYWR
jgi:type VI secretion system protein ImpJ